MTTANSAEARMLAVCDLITQAGAHLDAAGVARTAAVHLARLTRSDMGVVAAEIDGELVVGSYPRPVDDQLAKRLIEASRASRLDRPVWDVSANTCSAAVGSPAFGLVRASGPIDGTFSALDEWLVGVVAAQFETQLQLVAMHQERMQAAELFNDAMLAGELQQALLPMNGIDTPGLDLAARLRPARHVGGDMFDVFPAGETAIAVIADVAGKGSPASLLTATVHAAGQRAAVAEGANPGAIVAAVDDELRPLLERTDRIVTLAVAAIDSAQRTIRVASAGHSPIALRTGGAARLVEPGSPPLGVGHFQRVESVLRVSPGDVFVMASDGMLDQSGPSGERYGLLRFLSTMRHADTSSAQLVVDAAFSDLDAYAGGRGQDDDQAVVVVRIEGRR